MRNLKIVLTAGLLSFVGLGRASAQATHTLKPTPKTVAWGYYDAKAAAKTVASGYYYAQ